MTQLMLSRNLCFTGASSSTFNTLFTVAVKYYVHSSATFQFPLDIFLKIFDKVLHTFLARPMNNPQDGISIYVNRLSCSRS